ncbi:PqqD family protein [Bacillus sp. PS06]|uniref:PqqD family protein n=1 Tax=Bacillus sp. PS06 TaxID=2764176 RepID=UPI0017803241|nr:PqqD family protein [Bacillus sp. PS06]MBD8071117.1 PqqD family protein [Bacillus sp. PS06]
MSIKYIRRSDYEATILDDEVIILNTDNYTITKVNEVGGFCWELLHESLTINNIIDALQTKYYQDQTEEDVESFLSVMMECGLVKHAD